MQFANNEILDVTLQNDIMLIKMSQKVIGWTVNSLPTFEPTLTV